MKYSISLLKDYSRLCTVCLTYVILFVSVLAVYEHGVPTPYWLLGIPCILICYQLIQTYCYQPLLYILLHGSFWVIVMCIPFSHIEYRILFMIMLFFECSHAFQVWVGTSEKKYEGFPWYLYVSVAFVYAVAYAHNITDFSLFVYYIGLVLLLLHFIRFFITGLNTLLTKAEHATSMPAKKIMLTNTLILLFFLSLLVIIAIWLQYSNVDTLFSTLGQFFIKIVRFIIRVVSLISTIIHALFAKNTVAEETVEATQSLEEAFKELSEPSLIAQILDGIIKIAVVFILIYMVYRIIIALIKAFSKRYAQDADIVISLSKPREITKLPKESPSLLKRLQEFFKDDNRARIRRGYRYRIRHYKPTVYQPQDTPKEIAARVQHIHNEDIHELTVVYEKARYSEEEITFEDVEKGGFL